MRSMKICVAVLACLLLGAFTICCADGQARTPGLGSDVIRAKLLSTPEWIIEWGLRGAVLGTGRIRFEQQNGKLVGHLHDLATKQQCNFDVDVQADGFVYPGCSNFPKTMTLDEGDSELLFKGSGGMFSYTMRPVSQ